MNKKLKRALECRFYKLEGKFEILGKINPIGEELYNLFASYGKIAENKAYELLNDKNMDDEEIFYKLKEYFNNKLKIEDDIMKIKENKNVEDLDKYFETLLFGNNRKLKDIASICFETADKCSSDALGFCDVCDICYAKGDLRYKGHKDRMEDITHKIDKIMSDDTLFFKFVRYINNKMINVLRFNIVGDFRGLNDIVFIMRLSKHLKGIKIYGYSKRYDLAYYLENMLKYCPNVYLGVPYDLSLDIDGSNAFIVEKNIENWHNTYLKCLGDCNTCQKCFNFKDRKISCFIHSNPSKLQKYINTAENRAFIEKLILKELGLKIKVDKGLFVKSYCKALENNGLNVSFKLTKKGNKSYNIKTVPMLVKFLEIEGKRIREKTSTKEALKKGLLLTPKGFYDKIEDLKKDTL